MALETESHSRLETWKPRTNCTISTRYDNCSCSGSSPICSGALETLNHTPSPTSTCWKTCSQLSGALRKNFRPLTWSTRWSCQLSAYLSSHIPHHTPHPHSVTLAFSLFPKHSYLPNSGPLHWLFPGLECPAITSSRLASFYHLAFCLNVTSSENFPEYLHALSYLARGPVLFILNVTF